MKRAAGILLVTLTLIVSASHTVRGADEGARIWILPFTQSQPAPALEHLQDALPALVMVAVSGANGPHSVVGREELNIVLRELSLSLEGLLAPEERQRVGRLLGATVMVTGSFVRQGPQLHVTMRASDLETGIIASTADGVGPVNQPGVLIGSLYRRLAGDLGRRLPELVPDQIDEAPASNLHFMKGLGHYHSARYSLAIAEFMIAAEDRPLTDVSRLWLAKAYLAQGRYAHGCLELMTLMNRATPSAQARDLASECEQHVSREDLRMIRRMAGRRDATPQGAIQ